MANRLDQAATSIAGTPGRTVTTPQATPAKQPVNHYAMGCTANTAAVTRQHRLERAAATAPHEHCLIEDRPTNDDAAKQAGWQAFHWTPASQPADVLDILQPQSDLPRFSQGARGRITMPGRPAVAAHMSQRS